MTNLSARDVGAVLDLVGEAHHAEDLATFRSHVLPTIRAAIPADFASYNEVRADGGVGVTLVEPELPPWAYEVWARHAHQNPLVRHYQRTHDGRAYRFTDVVSSEELRKLDLFKELYARIGVRHQMAVAMPAPPSLVIGIVLSRAHRNFTERDRAMMNLARPHLIQAYRNVELRERLRGLTRALARGLDDSGESVVVVDPGGRVEFVNRGGAAAVVAATGGTAARGALLPPPLGPWLADGTNGGGGPILLGDGGRRFVVRCLASEEDRDLRILLFQSASRAVSREVLEGLGLTGREAEVLQGMMRGLSTLELAAQLEITRATVYKHSERIFAKLSVRDRVEAVAVAWAAVGGVR